MSATAESVQQSTQTSSTVQNADVSRPVVQQNLSTESTFDNLWNSGAFDSPKEAEARAEHAKGQQPAKEIKELPQAKAPVQKQAEPDDAQELTQQAQEERPTETEGEGETETPTKEYASVDEYLKDSGVDPESFMDLPVMTKVDGTERLVPIKDVIKGYQLEQHTQLKSLQHAESVRAFEQKQSQVESALKEQAQQSLALFQLAQQTLLSDYQGIDWNALQQADPGRYAALQVQYNQRAQAIQNHIQNLSQAKEAEQRRAQEDYAKNLPQQREKMIAAVPEWRDAAKFEAARKTMLEYAKTLGYTDQELGSINDYRQMLLLHDAARYRALQAAKPASLKQVRAAPTSVRAGSRADRNPKVVATQAARANWAANPRSEDAQAAYFEQAFG